MTCEECIHWDISELDYPPDVAHGSRRVSHSYPLLQRVRRDKSTNNRSDCCAPSRWSSRQRCDSAAYAADGYIQRKQVIHDTRRRTHRLGPS